MTTYVPLGANTPLEPPNIPSFLKQSTQGTAIEDVFKAITKARRIVVVTGTKSSPFLCDLCVTERLKGAGISVQAGIPDFRSSGGLFNTLKRDNPRENLSSGKDLFDASVFGVSRFSVIWLA